MLINLFTFYVVLSICSSVFAETNRPKPISWENAKSLAGYMPDAVVSAGNRVEFLDNTNACTGQFISRNGIYLTALHCMMKSILNDGPDLTYETVVTKPYYKGWFVRDFLQLPFQTYEIPGARRLRAQGETTEPMIISLGRGYFEFPPNITTTDEYNLIQAKASEFSIYQEDFGILKFILQKPENHSCIQISTQDPIAEANAWAIGFPQNLTGAEKIPQKFVLKAKLFTSISALKASRGEIVIYPEESWFDSNRLFVLAGEVLPGMSGGAVLNKSGQIIGIIIARTRSNDTIVLKSSFISTVLKSNFGEKEFATNLNCNN